MMYTKTMFWISPFVLLVLEFIWQFKINYPPTLEQLHLGISSPSLLWGSRVVTLLILGLAVFLFSKIVPAKIRKYFFIFIAAPPTFTLIWMSYPLDAVKLFIVSLAVFIVDQILLHKKTPAIRFYTLTGFGIGLVLILNFLVFKQSPSIFNAVSMENAQKEVTERFVVEDKLTPHTEFPLFVRRMGYNKYFIILKNAANESLTFFNLETLFFQEVHPMGQKAFVMFFWPTIFLFALSIWILVTKKTPVPWMLIGVLGILSFSYFITSGATMERRLVFAMIPIAIILSYGLDTIFASTWKLGKVLACLFIFLSLYGYATNLYDRYTRPAYWLDNRPLTYQFVFESLKTLDVTKYNSIKVPDTLYAINEYCPYYLDTCPVFTQTNFDLSKEPRDPNALYIGFIGNFVGPHKESGFPSKTEFERTLVDRGFRIHAHMQVRDNIASGYGQDIILAY